MTAGPVLTLALMLWGISAPSYWRDEADTLSAVSRPLPEMIRLLGHVDAVHGLYYLLLWPVTRLAGTGELATRLPSAVAMAAADFGIAVIARRLSSRRAAASAALVFAILPLVTAQGHDARPYAMVTASAVLASYLLLRAAADPRRRWFAAYGAALVLTGYLHMFALLLVPAHAITLRWPGGLGAQADRPGGSGQVAAGQVADRQVADRQVADRPVADRRVADRRVVCRRWLAAVLAAGACLVPLVILGWQQRGQIAWIARPGLAAAVSLATSFAGYSIPSALLVALLAVLGATRAKGPGRRMSRLALPWLILPPVTLFAVSEIKPVYFLPYVVFCLPALALLVGVGLAGLTWPALAAAMALLALLALPAQLELRAPGGGGSIRSIARVLARSERPGDAVIYPGIGVPPWQLAYPDGFGQLRDIWQQESAVSAGRLYGVRAAWPAVAARERGVCRIWAVEMGPHWHPVAPDLIPGFRLADSWRASTGRMRLWLYQRGPGCHPPAERPHGAAQPQGAAQ